MNRFTHLLLLICFCGLLAAGCQITPVETDRPVVVRDLSAEEQQAVQSDNRFGFELFREISRGEPNDNVFISPLSVSMALGMVLNGANGETLADMQKTLARSGHSLAEINVTYRSLIDLLTELDPNVAFQIANSIWYKQDLAVEPDFISTNKKYFDAEVRPADFKDPSTVEQINGWVDDKTNGKIDRILDRIDPAEVMFLINAIYFKGTWRFRFDEKNTHTGTFHLLDGGSRDVQMMSLSADLPYLSTPQFQAVDLPYGDSLFSMTILLPDPGEDINALADTLTDENWNTWTRQFQTQAVALEMPKFKLEYKQELTPMLTAMGMGVAFSDAADFTRIRKQGALAISRVLHKTFVEVNEEGTEAAAVTVVGVGITSVGSGGPIPFRVDRPFLFAIRERHSGTVLFIGKVMNPA